METVQNGLSSVLKFVGVPITILTKPEAIGVVPCMFADQFGSDSAPFLLLDIATE